MANLTQEFIDALHRLEETGNIDVISGLFTDDAELSNPLVVHCAAEKQGPKAFWQAYIGAFQDIESEFVNVVETEGIAVLERRSDGVIDGKTVHYGGSASSRAQTARSQLSGLTSIPASWSPTPTDEMVTKT